MKNPFCCRENNGLLFTIKSSLLLLLIIFGLCFVYCVCKRLFYPFELEWLEGEILCHAVRFLNSGRIYGPPETSFIPQIYPPLYFILIAPLIKFFTIQFWIPRIITIFSLCGLLLLLYIIPLKEGGQRITGLISAGFFISLYVVNGTWYDIGRVDMLFYLLMVSACFAVSYGNKKWAIVCAVVLFSLGFYAKQSAPLFIAFAVVYLFVKDRKKGMILFFILFLLLLVTFTAINYSTHGWYGKYTILHPLRHGAKRPDFLHEIRYDIFYELPLFFAMVIAFTLKRMLSIEKIKEFTIWEFTLIPAAMCYLIPRPLAGSERNELIPLTLWGCIIVGLLINKIHKLKNTRFRDIMVCLVYLLIIFQLMLLLYNPKRYIPFANSISRGFTLLSKIKDFDGEVYVPYHAIYGILAGKKMVFNAGAFWCFEMTSPEKFQPRDLIEKIKRRQFSAIILDGTGYYMLAGKLYPLDNKKNLFFLGDKISRIIGENYELAEQIPYQDPAEFRTIAGYRTRPERILRPRQ